MRFSVIFVVLSTVFASASAGVYPRQVAGRSLLQYHTKSLMSFFQIVL